MASSSLALRRLLSSTVVPRSLRAVRPAAASRLFNTNAVRSYEDGDDGVDRNHRSNRPVSRRGGDFFSGYPSSPFPHPRFLQLIPERSLGFSIQFFLLDFLPIRLGYSTTLVQEYLNMTWSIAQICSIRLCRRGA